MIHWPLPNNHVFYSALSALVNKLGSPYLGLRGVSLLASAGSLLLLYRLLKKQLPPLVSVTGCALFAAMYNVTQQAAQGRGYALSGFFLIAAANLLYEICVPEAAAEKGPARTDTNARTDMNARTDTNARAGRLRRILKKPQGFGCTPVLPPV